MKDLIDLLPQLPQVEENLRHKSLLRSSLFSARIEGNRLNLREIQYMDNTANHEDLSKKEVHNILKALRWILSKDCPQKISTTFIRQLHNIVMNGISPETGSFRTEPSAIFNSAGIAVYITPPPEHILHLIEELVKKANSSIAESPIRAAFCHFAFEKIHPFIDGNGRVGRLISTFILQKGGYTFRGLMTLEEYLDNNRADYYELLAGRKRDITPFVEFFLEGLCLQAEKTINIIKNVEKEIPEDRLLPRRGEILSIIRDHQTVSFDFIRRRFMKVPASTLHYDLKKLMEDKFIRKLGNTKGVFYTAN